MKRWMLDMLHLSDGDLVTVYFNGGQLSGRYMFEETADLTDHSVMFRMTELGDVGRRFVAIDLDAVAAIQCKGKS